MMFNIYVLLKYSVKSYVKFIYFVRIRWTIVSIEFVVLLNNEIFYRNNVYLILIS